MPAPSESPSGPLESSGSTAMTGGPAAEALVPRSSSPTSAASTAARTTPATRTVRLFHRRFDDGGGVGRPASMSVSRITPVGRSFSSAESDDRSRRTCAAVSYRSAFSRAMARATISPRPPGTSVATGGDGSVRIARAIPRKLPPANGVWPVASSNSVTPSAYRSARGPAECPSSTSGAM